MAVAEWDKWRKQRVALLLLLDEDEEEGREKKRKREIWTREWLRRRERGAYNQLVQELRDEDDKAYANYFRVPIHKFEELLQKVQDYITREDTMMRLSIKPSERLAVTLRFLASGETFSSLEKQFRISRTAISYIVVETCEAIIARVGASQLQVPNTTEAWLELSSKFQSRWNFPNGLFAIDGKRVLIQQPANSGSHYYDYKGNNSILAMVIVGPEYEILAADVGMNGRMSDGGNWSRNKFRSLLEDPQNPLNTPEPRPLPGRTLPVPFVAVGDDAFALTTYLLKPYPESSLNTEKRIFNYRLSRTRRISENVLGIMAQKWQVLRTVIRLEPEKATTIVLAIMALHNFMRSERCYVTVSDDELSSLPPATSWLDLPPLAKGQNYSNKAKAIRDEFCEYFNFQGAVSWQWVAARIDG